MSQTSCTLLQSMNTHNYMTILGPFNELLCIHHWWVDSILIQPVFQLVIIILFEPSFASYLIPNIINHTCIFTMFLDLALFCSTYIIQASILPYHVPWRIVCCAWWFCNRSYLSLRQTTEWNCYPTVQTPRICTCLWYSILEYPPWMVHKI